MSADYRPITDVGSPTYLKVSRRTRIVFRFFVGDQRVCVRMRGDSSDKKTRFFDPRRSAVKTQTQRCEGPKNSVLFAKGALWLSPNSDRVVVG